MTTIAQIPSRPPSYQSQDEDRPSFYRYCIKKDLFINEIIHLSSFVIILDLVVYILLVQHKQTWLPCILSTFLWFIVGDGQSFNLIPSPRNIRSLTLHIEVGFRVLAGISQIIWLVCCNKLIDKYDQICSLDSS